MELKSTGRQYTAKVLHCSNRTFMELKCIIQCPTILPSSGSNRTFMELKFLSYYGNDGKLLYVLIVPLWN